MATNDRDRIEDCVIETADRLRLIRADLADENNQVRRDRLSEELDKVLTTVLATERDEVLRRLLGLFLSGDFAVQGETEGLKTQLQLSDDLNINAKDLAELTTMLVEFVLKLDPLVWNTWRALSPRSGIRAQGSLAKKIGQFLSEDAEVSGAMVSEDLRVLQRLIAALATAVSRAGSQFAKRHLARFSPSEIAALVRMEPGGVFVSHEVKCWRKYVELAEGLDEDAIDAEIRKAVVDYVESLAKGMAR